MRFHARNLNVFVLVLVIGLAGCGLFDRNDRVSPTLPMDNAEQLGNFWVKDGPGGKYEVEIQDGQMQVSVPGAGTYMLTYRTLYGTFHIVFTALDSATLVIGLHQGDHVQDAYIQPGDLVGEDIPDPVYQNDTIIVYLLPEQEISGDGDIPNWSEFFEDDFELFVLIVDGEVVLGDSGIAGDGTAGDGATSGNCTGGKCTVNVSASGAGRVKPDGEKSVPEGASISIQFIPDSGCFADIISVTIGPLSFTDKLQQLGKDPKSKGHLVIHDVDGDLDVVATFGAGASCGKDTGKPPKDKK